MSRVGIAGAGIAGRLLAWQLARLGHEVEVFDPAPNALAPDPATAHGAAAFTAAGMLSPLAELDGAPPEVAERGWRSLDLWPGIVAALGPQYRTPALFRRNGSVLVTHPRDAGAADRVLARMRAAQVKQARVSSQVGPHEPSDDDDPSTLQIREPGHDPALEKLPQRLPQALTHDALHALEPALLPGLHGWLLPGEGQVDATRLLPALCAAAPGVRWHWGTRVNEVESGTLHVGGSAPVRFDVAVDTRGLGARATLPLRGVRGELLWLHAPGLELRRPVRCIHARHRVYLVPRHGDLVIVGATEIDSEDKSPVSVRSAIELLSAAHAIVPQLAEARIVRLDTHLRPATPDQAPLLHCERGLIRINGLFRHGFLLAPALIEEALLRSGLMETVRRREASHA
jgi:glycine oxidase